ncbi:hypothetical protein NDU88_005146 [Pleurodeles waltl]|uniref:Uncharacterized protein n=1 Tax=Pleurodeles waltl TaxID=8319 RepID=A0AAV7WTX3_PLEWA|nr:hypothetical protein NDU88_005146 [Pleurodeles waltl]
MWRTSRLRWLDLRSTRSIFRSMLWKAAGSTDGAVAVWVPVEEVCVCVVPGPVGCPAPVAMLGPGSPADVGTTVPALGGATWLDLVVVLVVAVVGKVGLPCGKALYQQDVLVSYGLALEFTDLVWSHVCSCEDKCKYSTLVTALCEMAQEVNQTIHLLYLEQLISLYRSLNVLRKYMAGQPTKGHITHSTSITYKMGNNWL